MEDYLLLAERNQAKAWEVIRSTRIIERWEEAGAEINLVGSLKLGLLMKHRDIDFHIYSRNLTAKGSFAPICCTRRKNASSGMPSIRIRLTRKSGR